MKKFVGRKRELETLRWLLKKSSSSLVVIRGRRRIGKSRLIEEFGKDMNCHMITGLPPTPDTTKQSQLDHFCQEVARSFDAARVKVDNWAAAFAYLAQLCSSGRTILAFDEISWMGSKDFDFLGYLKNAWDMKFSSNPELVLILCGSISSWIEENILKSTGFVGRISVDMRLEELPIADAAMFWEPCRNTVSAHEILKVLSITGGVPKYLEEMTVSLPAEENIRRLCFQPDGFLYQEFEKIFSDLFSKRASNYANIVEHLSSGANKFTEIGEAVGITNRTTLRGYLRDLIQAGFVKDVPTWNLKTLKSPRMKSYRLSDNYLRFYLRTILPSQKNIEDAIYQATSMTNLPAWDGIMGLQFENLVVKNAFSIFRALGIDPGDILRFGPYCQPKNARQRGCQVDLLIQTRNRTLYLCEIKFSAKNIGMEAVHEMREKQERIAKPTNYSTRLVLIHVNGLTDEAERALFHEHVVDFATFLN